MIRISGSFELLDIPTGNTFLRAGKYTDPRGLDEATPWLRTRTLLLGSQHYAIRCRRVRPARPPRSMVHCDLSTQDSAVLGVGAKILLSIMQLELLFPVTAAEWSTQGNPHILDLEEIPHYH